MLTILNRISVLQMLLLSCLQHNCNTSCEISCRKKNSIHKMIGTNLNKAFRYSVHCTYIWHHNIEATKSRTHNMIMYVDAWLYQNFIHTGNFFMFLPWPKQENTKYEQLYMYALACIDIITFFVRLVFVRLFTSAQVLLTLS